MSLFGLKVAKQFGEGLPSFKNQSEAETILFKQRDESLRQLLEMAKTSEIFVPDFTPEILKSLEKWYFELYESNGFSKYAKTREKFESCMAAYFGEVVIRNCPDAWWTVREFAFENGKYEIGVQKKLLHFMSKFTDHYKQPNNKRHQKIFGIFNQLFASRGLAGAAN
jgi:hypothetical protein